MSLLSRSWITGIAASLALACTACQPKTTAKPAEKKPAATRADRKTTEQPAAESAVEVEPKAIVGKPKPQELPPPSAIPKVALSDALRATCVVNAGDTFPVAELPDPDGKIHALNSLYGRKLSVVCFWRIGTTHPSRLVAAATLRDLMQDIAVPFDEKGVQVIGINVGDAAAAVGQEVSQVGVTFPLLLDPKREFFAKIAKDRKMPRIYLLDAGGKILWFDVEYRRQSREDLVQSIRVALGEL